MIKVLAWTVAILFFIFVLAAVVIHWIFGGTYGYDANIAEARSHKVLLRTYRVPDKIFQVNDTISFRVEEAWIENKWYWEKGLFTDREEIAPGYYLRLRIVDIIPKGYLSIWFAGKDKYGAGAITDGLYTEINSNFPDSISIPLQKIKPMHNAPDEGIPFDTIVLIRSSN